MSHDASSVLVKVTKSAVMKTDMTPSIPNRGEIRASTSPWSATSEEVYVAVSPTGPPTLNFIARGFGVVSTVTAIAVPLSLGLDRSGGRP